MQDIIDCHITLRQAGHAVAESAEQSSYNVAIQIRRSWDGNRTALPADAEPRITLDWVEARRLLAEPGQFGQWLGRWLLGPEPVRRLFDQAWTQAQDRPAALRVRLQLPPALQELPWELLAVDGVGNLATTDRVFFSRYLTSEDARPLRLTEPDVLSAAVVVADPADLDTSRYARPHVARMLANFSASFPTEPQHGPARLSAIFELLRAQPDVFYLAAHGGFARQEAGGERTAMLILEDDNGSHAFVPGLKLAELFNKVQVLPRLVVLASCASAGDGSNAPESDPHAALGPLLINVGVPAVLAMHGTVSMETTYEFLKVFFAELDLHGAVDRAAALARLAIADRPDAWAPRLFMRLEDGRLWMAPVPPPAALRPYLEAVIQRTSQLPLIPLDPGGRESAHISLEKVFVGLQAGQAEIVIDAQTDRRERYVAALAHIFYQRKLVLLGDPGSGKSTLLRYLAHVLANHALDPGGGWRRHLTWLEQRLRSKQGTANEDVGDSAQPHRHLDSEPGSADQQGVAPDLAYTARMGRARMEVWRQIERHWQGDRPVPVLVSLSEFAATEFDPASPTAIWQYVAQRLASPDEDLAEAVEPLRELAQNRGVVFLLDGVDEVPVRERRAVWQAIRSMDNGPYGGCRRITTCRILSFFQGEAPPADAVQTLEPFDREQIASFVQRWYGALVASGELDPERGRQLGAGLQETATGRLLHLAQNPMLLTIMALVQTYYGTLPQDRAQLYQACVETMLLRWQRHKEQGATAELPEPLRDLDLDRSGLERLLWEIAWEAHQAAIAEDEVARIPESQIIAIARQERHLGDLEKAARFVTYTEKRAHLLIGQGGADARVYSFPHRTFQEYLAACHLVSSRRFLRLLPGLAAQGDVWREVLNLAAGTLVINQNNREKAIDAVQALVQARDLSDGADGYWHCIWLAGEMALVVGRERLEQDEVGREILPELRQRLGALLDQGRLLPRQRLEAGDALAALGDERPGVCTLEPTLCEPIKGGTITLRGNDEEHSLAAFRVARYPVTNAQFRQFVDDGGYGIDVWWSDDGLQQRNDEGWNEPAYWDDQRFNRDNQPVVGVSWYEAEAYANWLSAKTGKPYRLPTEAEWERAAGHTDGREFAWNGDWAEDHANTKEAGLNRPSAVGMFPRGAAVCEAQDMCGNVFEWTASWYDDDRDTRVLRGGSFYDSQGDARVGDRYNFNPFNRSRNVGVRLVSPDDPGS